MGLIATAMQTFLPYPDFATSAAVLDDRRLNAMRSEPAVVASALLGLTPGWRRHPCTLAWSGHVAALVAYGLACVDEWERRGFRDVTARARLERLCCLVAPDAFSNTLPGWLGRPEVHAAYRALLKGKDSIRYAQFDEAPIARFPWEVLE